jgi:hypothetical protein
MFYFLKSSIFLTNSLDTSIPIYNTNFPQISFPSKLKIDTHAYTDDQSHWHVKSYTNLFF